MTQQLGLDQMVIGDNGTATIFTNNPTNNWQGAGFRFDASLDSTNGSGYGNLGGGGMDGIGHNAAGSTTTTNTISVSGAAGVGGSGSYAVTTVNDARGNPVVKQVTHTGTVVAGINTPGPGFSTTTTPGIQLNPDGVTPVFELAVTTPLFTGGISINLATLEITPSGQITISKPGATAGVGVTSTTTSGSGVPITHPSHPSFNNPTPYPPMYGP